MDDGDRRGDRAGLLRLCPKFSHGANLGERKKLVLIDAQRKADMRRCIDQRLACFLEHPQMRHGGREHDAKFLRFGGARIVKYPAIGLEQNAGNAKPEEMGKRLRHRSLQRFDRHAQAAGSGKYRRRVDPERKMKPGRVRPPRGQQVYQPVDGEAALGMGVDAEISLVERNTFERLRKGLELAGRPYPKAFGAPSKTGVRPVAP